MTPPLPTTLLWTLMGLACIWDVTQRRIPNQLILVGLLAGVGLQAHADGLVGVGSSLFGALVALAVLIAPFAARVLGGGDVKLAMVAGAFLGWRGGLHVILLGALAHGVVALGWLAFGAVSRRFGRPLDPERGIPHALGFAAATVVYTLGLITLF